MKKVLVVDNNPVLLHALSSLLQQMGCEVETSKDGLEALEYLENNVPDIIFTDLIMPHVSGEKICRVVRNSAKFDQTFLVILSAVEPEEWKKLGDSLDYDLFIVKGTVKELQERLEKALFLSEAVFRSKSLILAKEKNKADSSFQKQSIASELLLAKQHLNNIINTLSEGIIELSDQGVIVSINTGGLEILNLKEEDLLGKPVTGMCWQLHQEGIEKWIDAIADGEEVNYEIQEDNPLRIEDKIVTCSFMTIIQKGKIFALVILRDITRQFFAEEHKRRMDQSIRLMRKMEAMSSMAGGVAHDFNNLLAVICGNLDLLGYQGENLSDEEQVRTLEHARQAAYAAADLTRKISHFSGFGIIDRKKIRIDKLLQEGVREYSQKSQLYLSLINENPDCIVKVDKEQLITVIENIIKNGVEASEAESVVEIHSFVEELHQPLIIKGQYVSAGKYVRINIKDHGAGISSRSLLQVFDPYFTTKKRGADKGIGLGLTVVYATMRNHGGYVVIHSAGMDKGTEVSLFLPKYGKAETADLLEKNSYSPQGITILLMEDDEELRDIAIIMLEYLGFSVLSAANEADAVKLLQVVLEKKGKIDLAILNIYGINSEEGGVACRKIKELHPELPVIATSGAVLHPIMKDCNKYGFDNTLTKPYTIDSLSHVIQSVMKK